MSRVLVRGVGWIAGSEYGCVVRGERSRLGGDLTGSGRRKEIFVHAFKNFGRLDPQSRMTAAGIALALRDGSVGYSPERKQDIGIVGTSGVGSLATDLLFFRDYVDCGRKLARGNLFIYTLPSSPLGEAAIHFGLTGPLFYAGSGKEAFSMVVGVAEDMILQEAAEAMLAGVAGEDAAVYCLLAKEGWGAGQGLCDAGAARRAAAREPFSVLITAFEELKGKKDIS